MSYKIFNRYFIDLSKFSYFTLQGASGSPFSEKVTPIFLYFFQALSAERLKWSFNTISPFMLFFTEDAISVLIGGKFTLLALP